MEADHEHFGQPGHTLAWCVAVTDQVSNTAIATATASVRDCTKYYYFGAQRVAMRDADDDVFWLHGDHLGSTSLTTDEHGDVVTRQLYYPFGETRWVTGTLPTDFGFTGEREDAYTQLHQMGVRWYDNRIGRWISPDTIVPDFANPQSLNRYAYVYNNVVRFRDPTGRFSEDEIEGIFGVDSWAEVEAFFTEDRELEGLWGWLEVLRKAVIGDTVGLHSSLSGVLPEQYTLLFQGNFVVNESGRISVSGQGPGEPKALWTMDEFHEFVASTTESQFGNELQHITLKHRGFADKPYYAYREHWHYDVDLGRVDMLDLTLDVVGLIASLVGANPIVEAFDVSDEVTFWARSVDTGLGFGGSAQSALEQDWKSLAVDLGGFAPGPIGGGFNLAAVIRDLAPAFSRKH